MVGCMRGRDHLQIKIFYFLLIKKHREKAKSTGKTQGILSWWERGNPVIGSYHKCDCKLNNRCLYCLFSRLPIAAHCQSMFSIIPSVVGTETIPSPIHDAQSRKCSSCLTFVGEKQPEHFLDDSNFAIRSMWYNWSVSFPLFSTCRVSDRV